MALRAERGYAPSRMGKGDEMSTQLDEYLEAEIQSLLTDGRVAELGITVHRREHLLGLRGDWAGAAGVTGATGSTGVTGATG